MTQQNKIEKMYRDKQSRIKMYVDKKEKSIAFWASMNNAVNFTKDGTIKDVFKNHKEIYDYWQKWIIDENAVKPIDLDKAEKLGKEHLKKLNIKTNAEIEQLRNEEVVQDLQEQEKIEEANRFFNEAADNQPEIQAENSAIKNNKLNK